MKSRSVQAYLLYLNSNTESEIAVGYACHDVISR